MTWMQIQNSNSTWAEHITSKRWLGLLWLLSYIVDYRAGVLLWCKFKYTLVLWVVEAQNQSCCPLRVKNRNHSMGQLLMSWQTKKQTVNDALYIILLGSWLKSSCWLLLLCYCYSDCYCIFCSFYSQEGVSRCKNIVELCNGLFKGLTSLVTI